MSVFTQLERETTDYRNYIGAVQGLLVRLQPQLSGLDLLSCQEMVESGDDLLKNYRATLSVEAVIVKHSDVKSWE